jgi:hypothetical protein
MLAVEKNGEKARGNPQKQEQRSVLTSRTISEATRAVEGQENEEPPRYTMIGKYTIGSMKMA